MGTTHILKVWQVTQEQKKGKEICPIFSGSGLFFNVLNT